VADYVAIFSLPDDMHPVDAEPDSVATVLDYRLGRT
jgi:hypothetical protein